MGSNSVILDFMFSFFNNIHVLKDENYLVMKASEVIPVFLKDATWIASLGLIEGLHISMSCPPPHPPIPFPSYFSLSSFVSDEKSLDRKVFVFCFLSIHVCVECFIWLVRGHEWPRIEGLEILWLKF